MLKNSKKALVISTILVGASVTSYIVFSNYSPKILRKLEEVKGLSTINTENLPYPAGSSKISFFETPDVKQTTLQTKKSLSEINQFYRNIYLNKRYNLISENSTQTLLELKFKKGEEIITIIGTKQENSDYTTFSVETRKQ